MGRIPTGVSWDFPGLNSFGARRRATSAWLAEEAHFLEITPPVTVLKPFLLQKPTPEENGKGYRYPINNEVVDDLRRITKAYAKNIGGLPIVYSLPRREYQKKDRPQLEDSVLVEDLEELVETTLQ